MAQPLLEKGAGGEHATPRLVAGEGGGGGVQSKPLERERKRQHHMLREKNEASPRARFPSPTPAALLTDFLIVPGFPAQVPISDTPVPWVPWDGKGTAPRIELKWKARADAP